VTLPKNITAKEFRQALRKKRDSEKPRKGEGILSSDIQMEEGLYFHIIRVETLSPKNFKIDDSRCWLDRRGFRRLGLLP